MELCVSGIETRAKPEITMAIKSILTAPILSAIATLLWLNTLSEGCEARKADKW